MSVYESSPCQIYIDRVKDQSFPAHFSRAAYYQLAEYIEEDKGSFFLVIGEKKHRIR